MTFADLALRRGVRGILLKHMFGVENSWWVHDARFVRQWASPLSLLAGFRKDCDLNKHILEQESREEVKHLNRVLGCWAHGLEWERDPTQLKTLARAYGMEGFKGKGTIDQDSDNRRTVIGGSRIE